MKIYITMMLLLLSLGLFACSKTPLTYAEYEDIHIESWDEVDDILTDGLVLIYYYSPHCPDCKSIEQEFSSIIHKTDEKYTVYLLKSMSVDEQGIPPIDLRGVPALFIYEDMIFQEMLLGPGNVIEYMRNL
jgi:thiol-disulfide isomerase/thioredoxin